MTAAIVLLYFAGAAALVAGLAAACELANDW